MVEAIRGFEIEIDKKEVCRFLGYDPERPPKNGSISSVIDDEIAEAYDLIEPACYYRRMNIQQVLEPDVILEDSLALTSSTLSRILCHCSQVTVFLATIGQPLEGRVTQLMDEGQVLRATALDATGSEAVERVTCHVQERIAEIAAAHGDETTLRYSPGHCDWDICQQSVLFQIMDSASTGVSLSDECLMTPRKTVSGIIGLGECETYRLSLSACLDCTRKDCPTRR